ncbi:uncharacterized protein LOC127061217 isoform X2 [Serinus canaria]|uniref:uncharacterized protein LOC127061217 isoform X2 n=1 Tax=Serinus canaria TaxID=9135 RepID=UPI0021CCFDA2|nr:uncharacterized protein LOC127061217 isoform X2 [Serinus canaria]
MSSRVQCPVVTPDHPGVTLGSFPTTLGPFPTILGSFWWSLRGHFGLLATTPVVTPSVSSRVQCPVVTPHHSGVTLRVSSWSLWPPHHPRCDPFSVQVSSGHSPPLWGHFGVSPHHFGVVPDHFGVILVVTSWSLWPPCHHPSGHSLSVQQGPVSSGHSPPLWGHFGLLAITLVVTPSVSSRVQCPVVTPHHFGVTLGHPGGHLVVTSPSWPPPQWSLPQCPAGIQCPAVTPHHSVVTLSHFGVTFSHFGVTLSHSGGHFVSSWWSLGGHSALLATTPVVTPHHSGVTPDHFRGHFVPLWWSLCATLVVTPPSWPPPQWSLQTISGVTLCHPGGHSTLLATTPVVTPDHFRGHFVPPWWSLRPPGHHPSGHPLT